MVTPHPISSFEQNMNKPAVKDTEIVIVGAGPVGLIIALLVARAGIKCIVLETLGEIIQSPRAIAYGPAAVVELERAGVAQECREIGMEPSDFEFTLRWITLDNKLVADLPFEIDGGVSSYYLWTTSSCGSYFETLTKV